MLWEIFDLYRIYWIEIIVLHILWFMNCIVIFFFFFSVANQEDLDDDTGCTPPYTPPPPAYQGVWFFLIKLIKEHHCLFLLSVFFFMSHVTILCYRKMLDLYMIYLIETIVPHILWFVIVFHSIVISDWCRLDWVTQSHSKTPTYTPFYFTDCGAESEAGAATPPPYDYEGVDIWRIVMLAIEHWYEFKWSSIYANWDYNFLILQGHQHQSIVMMKKKVFIFNDLLSCYGYPRLMPIGWCHSIPF